MEKDKNIVIVIPSLEPDKALIDYVDSLLYNGFKNVVVVDDGSSEKCQDIFKLLESKDGIDVIHHEVNKGKGRALKTAYEYIKNNYQSVYGIITADSDGQHLATDCYKLATKMKEGKRGLYLGTRNFND